MAKPAKCPQCSTEVKNKRTGCEECLMFQCTRCKEWVHWDLVADDADEDDTPLCQQCWNSDADEEDEDDGPPDFDEELDPDWDDQDEVLN